LLAVVALTAPAFAADDVYINLETFVIGGEVFVEVSYDASGASQLVRGFSFDMELDNGGVFQAIDQYKTDVYSTSGAPGYGVFLGTIQFDSADPPNITDEGSPIAVAPDALGTLGDPGITVEAASLYDPAIPADAPLNQGLLFRVKVSKLITALTITADEDTRGGIVMEDGSKANLICPGYMVAWGIDEHCNADTDDTDTIDIDDWPPFRDSFLKTYASHYDGTTGLGKYDPRGDWTQDGVVDISDWPAFRDNFLKAPASWIYDCDALGYPKAWPPGT
jgi:hypothetical protein